jgi:hypothetical protein
MTTELMFSDVLPLRASFGEQSNVFSLDLPRTCTSKNGVAKCFSLFGNVDSCVANSSPRKVHPGICVSKNGGTQKFHSLPSFSPSARFCQDIPNFAAGHARLDLPETTVMMGVGSGTLHATTIC